MPFTSKPTKGYFATFATGRASGKYTHAIGGANKVHGAWCLPCQRPLLLVMTLDTRDPRLGLSLPRGRETLTLDFDPAKPLETDVGVKKSADLPLFYCWHCMPCLTYRLNPHGGVDVLDHDPFTLQGDAHAAQEDGAPYGDYPSSFMRRRVKLAPVPEQAQSLIHEGNSGTLTDKKKYDSRNGKWLRPRHQVGGEPFFSQGNFKDGDVRCALCGGEMPLIASVADDAGGRKHFAGDPFVHMLFHWCEPCQVVFASHECD